MDNRPIGIFDSGVGGLTVAKEIMNRLGQEEVIYFGDTARIPYGSKSKETIIRYSRQITRFLLSKNVKAIVIACGTASAMAMQDLRETFKDIPVIGVVENGAKAASQISIDRRIGVIATEGTVATGSYENLIQHFKKDVSVYSKACPLFVPLVEEGWAEDPVTEVVAERYLKELKEKSVDTLVLGCTHYPLLTGVIGRVMGEGVALINPAFETAVALEQILKDMDSLADHERPGHFYYVSDRAQKFEDFAKEILEKPFLPVEQINIEAY